MVIFLVSNNYRPYNAGIVYSLESLQAGLKRQGHTSFIITLDFLNTKEENPHVIRLYCPIRFRYKKKYIAIPFKPKHQLNKLIDQYKPDIIHVHHPFLLGSAALNVAKKRNIPIVFTYHSIYEAYSHYFPTPQTITKKIISSVVSSFCKKVDGIIAPTETIKTKLTADGIQKPIIVIPSAIRAEFFSNKTIQSKVTLNQYPVELLTVSRFEKEKDIPFLLRSIKLLDANKFRLTIAGFGTEIESLRRYAYHTLQLSAHQILFVENPKPNELLQLYDFSHFFIFASTTETQGLVLGEAMSRGLPVIARNAPAIVDIVINEYNGFLINNENEMANVLNTITDHHYCTLRLHAQQTSLRYTAEQFGIDMIDFYKNVIDANNLK